MVSPQPGQPLILYVSATHTTASGSLGQEIETLNGDKKMLHLDQKVLFRNGEDMLHRSHECNKAVTLL
jgi:hypothetical protein